MTMMYLCEDRIRAVAATLSGSAAALNFTITIDEGSQLLL